MSRLLAITLSVMIALSIAPTSGLFQYSSHYSNVKSLLPDAFALTESHLAIFANATYVIPGEGVSVTLVLFADPNDMFGSGIANKNLTLTANGTEYLVLPETIQTDSGGFATIHGLKPLDQNNKAFELLAHFAGDNVSAASDSDPTYYYTVDNHAKRMPVSIPDTASPVTIHVSGFDNNPSFNANITFGSVQAGAAFNSSVIVGQCSAPSITNQNRFVPLDDANGDLCLRIYPNFIGSFFIVNNAKTMISISYQGADLQSSSDDAVDMFFTDSFASPPANTIIQEVTASRNSNSQIVSGNASAGQGDFAVGKGNHGEAPAGAVRKYLFVGDDQEVRFRNVADTTNQTATLISVLPSTLVNGTQVTAIIHYPNENLDTTSIDRVSAKINSTSSDPTISVDFVETGVNTEEFAGSFGVITNGSTGGNLLLIHDGDSIKIWPDQQPYMGRFNATLNGIGEAGVVQMSDYLFDPLQLGGLCFTPILEPVNMTLIDATLGSGSSIAVTMSLANALPGNVSLSNPAIVKMYHLPRGQSWNITPINTSFDNDTKTVSGVTTSDGLFVLGFDTGCGGGAGGGFGRPGAGVVLDFVASIATSPPPPPPPSGGGGASTINSNPTDQGDQSPIISNPPGQTTIQAGNAVNATTTVTASGSGYLGGIVGLTFENVTSPGTVQVTEQLISSLPNNILTSIDSGVGSMTSIDGGSFDTSGPIFDIKTAKGLAFDGMVEVTIPYRESMVGIGDNETQSGADNIRLLHYNGSGWEDVTTRIDQSAHTVSGKVSSFSPVVAAIVQDGTFAESYFESHPLSKFADIDTKDGALAIHDSNDQSVSRAPPGKPILVVNTLKNLQRSAQPYTYILQIEDGRGVVVDLVTKSGTLDNGESDKIATSWSAAQEKGTYSIKVFVIDDSGDIPIILKTQALTKLEVE